MKNTLCIILIALLPFVGTAQNIIGNEVPSCTSCDNNEVNLKKGASALGSQNISTGVNSLASGFQSYAFGDYSMAFGYQSKANEEYAMAMGKNASANGKRSIALGLSSIAGGRSSFAIGAYTTTMNDALKSIAMGSRVTAQGQSSMVFGYGSYNDSIVNEKDYSLMIGFNSNIPTFYVGPSDGAGTFGNVGIGTTEPSELLEVNGNLKVNAHALITTANIDQLIVTGNTNFSNQDVSGVKRLIGYGNSLKLQNNGYGTAKITLASDGNIGVGTSEPSHALEVDGDFSVSMQSWFQNNLLQTTGKYIQSSQIKAPDATGLSLTNQSGDGLFVDEDGNVGIGTNAQCTRLQISGGDVFIEDQFSGLILKSPDGQCWKGTAGNDGSFNLASIECDQITGTKKPGLSEPLKAFVYPNPAGSKIYIEIPDNENILHASVYNEQGVLLKSVKLKESKTSLSLRRLPAGVLIVKVYGQDGMLVTTEKIIHQ